MFYLTTHSTRFIYGYMASDIWLRTILIVRKETRCRHIGYSYRLTARVLLYAPSHRQDNTYHSLCYTSHGALAGTRNSSMGPPHEGSMLYPTHRSRPHRTCRRSRFPRHSATAGARTCCLHTWTATPRTADCRSWLHPSRPRSRRRGHTRGTSTCSYGSCTGTDRLDSAISLRKN